MKELLKQVGSKLEQLESDGFELEMAGLLGPPSGNDERVPVSKLKGVEFLRKPSPLVIVPFVNSQDLMNSLMVTPHANR